MQDIINILRSTLTYLGDEPTLPFVRAVSSGYRNRYKAGTRVGCANSRVDGYACLRLGSRKDSELILMHRAVWMWHNGEIPSGIQIDHISNDRSDNRIENLRLATPAINSQNHSYPWSHNLSSGVLGVYFRPDCPIRPWFARITANGNTYKSQQFATIEEATVARDELATKHMQGYIKNPC